MSEKKTQLRPYSSCIYASLPFIQSTALASVQVVCHRPRRKLINIIVRFPTWSGGKFVTRAISDRILVITVIVKAGNENVIAEKN